MRGTVGAQLFRTGCLAIPRIVENQTDKKTMNKGGLRESTVKARAMRSRCTGCTESCGESNGVEPKTEDGFKQMFVGP